MKRVIVLAGLTVALLLAGTQPRHQHAYVRAIPTIVQLYPCVLEALEAPCVVQWPNGHVVLYYEPGECAKLRPTTLDVECVELP